MAKEITRQMNLSSMGIEYLEPLWNKSPSELESIFNDKPVVNLRSSTCFYGIVTDVYSSKKVSFINFSGGESFHGVSFDKQIKAFLLGNVSS